MKCTHCEKEIYPGELYADTTRGRVHADCIADSDRDVDDIESVHPSRLSTIPTNVRDEADDEDRSWRQTLIPIPDGPIILVESFGPVRVSSRMGGDNGVWTIVEKMERVV